MNKELANITLQLLKRVNLTGEEVPYYNAVVNELTNIVVQADQEEVLPVNE